MTRFARILVILLPAALLACPGGEEATTEGVAAAPVATPAPAAPSPFAATKLSVPLAGLNEEALRAALTGGGWEMASVSTSGGLLTAMARKNGTLATVSYQNPIHPAHSRHLQRDTKAIHVEGNVLLGVTVRGNDVAASALLTSLLGHAPSGAAAAAAAPATPATPATPAPATPTPTAPTPAAPAVPAGSPWAGTAPLSCGAAQQMTIVGQTVSLPGQTAITAAGMCQLTLINCTITAGQVVNASGMARITIQGGRIEGSQASIVASGTATVTVQGAQVVGPVQRSGRATVTGAQ